MMFSNVKDCCHTEWNGSFSALNEWCNGINDMLNLQWYRLIQSNCTLTHTLFQLLLTIIHPTINCTPCWCQGCWKCLVGVFLTIVVRPVWFFFAQLNIYHALSCHFLIVFHYMSLSSYLASEQCDNHVIMVSTLRGILKHNTHCHWLFRYVFFFLFFFYVTCIVACIIVTHVTLSLSSTIGH